MIVPVLLLLLQAPGPVERTSPQFDRAAAVAREAALARTSPPIHPDGARSTLNAILAERGFNRARMDTWQGALARQVRDWFARLWERTFGRAVGRRAVATTIAWIVATAAVLVLVVWLARIASPRRRERPLSMGPIEVPRLPGHILAQQAAAAIRAGNIREGARLAYQASVSRLDEIGALRIDNARTPRESLRLLDPGHRRRPAFARLTAIFERIWYGSRAPAADCGDEILQLLRDLECLSFDRAK